MDTLRKIRRKFEDDSANSEYHEVDLSLQSQEKAESCYHDSRSSEDTQTPLQPDSRAFYPTQPRQSRVLKIIVAVLAVALAVVSTSHMLLLLSQIHPQEACNRHQIPHQHPEKASAMRQLQTTDCGASVAEAKAKGCAWDELTKAWLPAECPTYGVIEYRLEGMLWNPHDNATSWEYYTAQDGTINLSLNILAEDEGRDPSTTVWTTSRQHLTHCAWSLKRTIWAYENGLGHYEKVSLMHHVNHCIDTLYRRAVRGDAGVDLLTTTTRVHFGNCTF